LGPEKTRKRILDHYYWTGITNDVNEYVRNCDKCQFFKDDIRKAPVLPHYIPKKPFELLSIDLIGPLNITTRNNRYILVVLDHLTRYPYLIPVPEISSLTIASSLINEVFSHHGVPKLLLSDRGSNFTSNIFKKIMQLLGIKKLETTSYRPQCNGALERLNKTVISVIRTQSADDWDTCLPYVAHAIRTATHSTTKQTPAELLFGSKPNPINPHPLHTSLDGFEILTDIPETSINKCMKEIHDRAKTLREATISEFNKLGASRSDKATDTPIREFSPGDLVLLKLNANIKGRHKFEARFKGPFEVMDKINIVNYRIRNMETGRVDTVHIDRIKIYNGTRPNVEKEQITDQPCSDIQETQYSVARNINPVRVGPPVIPDPVQPPFNNDLTHTPASETLLTTPLKDIQISKSGRHVKKPIRLIEEI